MITSLLSGNNLLVQPPPTINIKLIFTSHKHARAGGYVIGAGIHLYIRECGSTLYVGLMGMFRMQIQKSTGVVPPFFPIKVETV